MGAFIGIGGIGGGGGIGRGSGDGGGSVIIRMFKGEEDMRFPISDPARTRSTGASRVGGEFFRGQIDLGKGYDILETLGL